MTLTRRQLINRGGAIGAGAVAVSFGMSATDTAAARPGESQGSAELFPPLKAASDDLLALPPGFEYEVVAKAGATSIHDGSGTIIGKTPDRAGGVPRQAVGPVAEAHQGLGPLRPRSGRRRA
jgi:secreted PhoX family phosphatase